MATRRDPNGVMAARTGEVRGRASARRWSWWVAVAACAASLLSPAYASPPTQDPLRPAHGSGEGKFGTSVSIDGDTAVIGAPDEGGTPEQGGMGAAYVFTRRDGTWVEEATLVAPVRRDGDKFGFNVAIDGDTIVVGAPNAEELLAGPGVAYVFVRRGDAWPLQATLTPSQRKPDDAFGYGVAVSGDVVVVGANGGNVAPSADAGAAYVFSRTGDVWTEEARLTAGDGRPDDSFGYRVAVLDDTVAVSAISGDVGAGIDQGAAYVFTRTGSTWTQEAKLWAADGLPRDSFGESLAVARDTVVVGAPFDDIGLNPKQGSAYVFHRQGEAWTQEAKLIAPAPSGDVGDFFGRSVAVSRDTVVVGAHFDEVGGAVYAFDRVRDGWAQPTRFTASIDGALLGNSVGVSGATVIAGANFAPGGGAAYLFRLRPPPAAAGAGADAPRPGPEPASGPSVQLPQVS